MKMYDNLFREMISPENLFLAWEEFRKGKRDKPDVQLFEWELEQNIFQLHHELISKSYRHGPYHGFHIADPKLRHIHKATVRDRVVHHAVFKVLNRVFEPTFITDSFSCRIGKGTHKGVVRVQKMIRQVSKSQTHPCYALKCDIKKFFDTVDHGILLAILQRRIKDPDFLWLLEEIAKSYVATQRERERERERVNAPPRVGIPIGNLTSQIFANIYMNEFDQFVKHDLKVRHYARYTDDFVVIADESSYLENLLPSMSDFLSNRLALSLHPEKVFIQSCHRGIDFLGYVIFPHYRLMRSRTRKRMLKKLKHRVEEYQQGLITEYSLRQSLHSYLGALSHADAYKLSRDIRNRFWF
jgi:retron-type reverse transcriptase